jgi:hypothetical protein
MVVVAMLIVFPIVGGAVKGPIGVIGGIGAALLLWCRHVKFVDDLKEDRERRARGEPPFTRLELVLAAAILGAAAFVIYLARH